MKISFTSTYKDVGDNMELLQLRYFCEAAECENFSHTAEKNGVPTSNISQTVKRLEKELGVKLFLRGANRITLSDEGKVFYEGVKRALVALDSAKASLEDLSAEANGEIKLLIRAHRRTTTLAIERFKRLYPGVQIIIKHDTDTAYSSYSFIISDGAEKREGYDREHLMTEKIVLAVPVTHHLASKRAVSLSELSDENFVAMSRSSRLTELSESLCRAAGFTPKVVISAEDPYYVRKYVDIGLGIALVPGISWRGMFSENTVFIDVGDCRRDIYLYTYRGREISRAERAFLDILRSTFREESEVAITNKADG